jgi:hypothetical protein
VFLVLAFPFLMGGIILLFQKGPSVVIASPTRQAWSQTIIEASESMAHGAGVLGIVVGGILVGIYLQMRYGA